MHAVSPSRLGVCARLDRPLACTPHLRPAQRCNVVQPARRLQVQCSVAPAPKEVGSACSRWVSPWHNAPCDQQVAHMHRHSQSFTGLQGWLSPCLKTSACCSGSPLALPLCSRPRQRPPRCSTSRPPPSPHHHPRSSARVWWCLAAGGGRCPS